MVCRRPLPIIDLKGEGHSLSHNSYTYTCPTTKNAVSFSIEVPSGHHVTTSTSCIPALVGTWQNPYPARSFAPCRSMHHTGGQGRVTGPTHVIPTPRHATHHGSRVTIGSRVTRHPMTWWSTVSRDRARDHIVKLGSRKSTRLYTLDETGGLGMKPGWPHLEPHLGPAHERLGGVVQVHGVAPHHPGLPLRRVVALRLPARRTLHQVPHAARLHAPLQPATARQPDVRSVGQSGSWGQTTVLLTLAPFLVVMECSGGERPVFCGGGQNRLIMRSLGHQAQQDDGVKRFVSPAREERRQRHRAGGGGSALGSDLKYCTVGGYESRGDGGRRRTLQNRLRSSKPAAPTISPTM